VLPIRLPALRERLADLEALVESLSEDIARRSGLPARSVSPEALALLARQDWPGNIRELRNTLEQAALMTDDLVLEARHFNGPMEARRDSAPGTAATAATVAIPSPPVDPPPDLPQAPLALRTLAEQVAEVERVAIAQALRDNGGNRAQTARQLGMSRAALYDRLARWPDLDQTS
jgi:DNA-binding NtrC family response regulator